MKAIENISASGSGHLPEPSQIIIPGFGLFKTDVQKPWQGKKLVDILLSWFPGGEVSFDLDDCDRVLRVKHNEVRPAGIIDLLKRHGFNCEELKD